VDDDVVVTKACPHHHARHDIQTKARSPFSDVARCCEAQAAAKANPNSWCPQGNFLILIPDEIQVVSW
jgi:hypothetical protein